MAKYYDWIGANHEIISPSKFKKIFGCVYSDVERKIVFRDAYIIKCPFAHEINDNMKPIIRSSFRDLEDEHHNMLDEI